VDVSERASDSRNDVSPHPGQGGSVLVGEASDGRPGEFGLGIVCADQGKDGPVASGYGENAHCKIRHPVSLNVRISALWEIIGRKGGHKSSVRTVSSRAARCRIARCQNGPQGIQSARRSACMCVDCGRTHCDRRLGRVAVAPESCPAWGLQAILGWHQDSIGTTNIPRQRG
jgi:hypothetical protein